MMKRVSEMQQEKLISHNLRLRHEEPNAPCHWWILVNGNLNVQLTAEKPNLRVENID